MSELADHGKVERKRKGGTRVLHFPITRATFDIPITRNEVEASGRQYSHQLIAQQHEVCSTYISDKLGLPEPQELLRIEAMHLADDKPFIFEDRWISLETVPEIAQIDFTQISANEWLVQNRPVSRFDLQFYAKNANAKEARVLKIKEGSAVLAIDRATWIGNRPITFVSAVTMPGYRMNSNR